jgi:hypothetical protein
MPGRRERAGVAEVELQAGERFDVGVLPKSRIH